MKHDRGGKAIRMTAWYRRICNAAPEVVVRVTRQECFRSSGQSLVEALHSLPEVVASAATQYDYLAKILFGQRLQGR